MNQVVYLKKLMLSGNPLVQISRGDLANLASLESLDLSNLPACMKIDSQAFATLPSLRSLRLFGLPRLESLHSRAILQHISTLEEAEIEVTEPALQDQLAPAFLPRVRELHVHGRGIFFQKIEFNCINQVARLLSCTKFLNDTLCYLSGCGLLRTQCCRNYCSR